MPFKDSVYTNPDMNEGLYQDPENSLLLAEYALATGGVQLGAISANLGASNPILSDPTLNSGGGDGGTGSGRRTDEILVLE